MAIKTCQERNWGVGTVLSSFSWKAPKIIMRLGRVDVLLDKERVKSFPADVREEGYECQP
jgi:hypothetical protein